MSLPNLRLLWPHTAIIEAPYLGDYMSTLGLYVSFAELLPRIYTHVLKTHLCDLVAPGDCIMFQPHHALDYLLADGTRLWAIDERAVQAVITLEGWDHAPSPMDAFGDSWTPSPSQA